MFGKTTGAPEVEGFEPATRYSDNIEPPLCGTMKIIFMVGIGADSWHTEKFKMIENRLTIYSNSFMISDKFIFSPFS